ncbi:Maf family protein [Candidatus Fermentibacteria bacterium]|nr:Maf family protein [Candidatus Fermentibacteria bacterium]
MAALPALVLASTSSIRRELLATLGVPFSMVAPAYVEHNLGLAPREESLERARGKAVSVCTIHADATIVASDQLLVFRGEHRAKPVTDDHAAALLSQMRGVAHRLYTSLLVHYPIEGWVLEEVVVSTLRIHPDLTDEEIRAYVAADHPAGCAGGYKLERLGIRLFSSIDTPDFTAILGLPMLSLGHCLRSLGYRTT